MLLTAAPMLRLSRPPTKVLPALRCDDAGRTLSTNPNRYVSGRAAWQADEPPYHVAPHAFVPPALLVLVTVTLNRFERPHPSWLACLPFTPPQPSCYWHQNQPSFAPLEPFLNGDMPPPMMIDSALPGSHPISFPHLTAFHKRRL